MIESDQVGRQELEIVIGDEHISFTTSKIGRWTLSASSVQVSQFPRLTCFWKWSREPFIGSSFVVRGANDRDALLWKPHDPNFGWSLRVQPEIIMSKKKEKNAEHDWRSEPCPCSWRCSLGQVFSRGQTRSPSRSRATPLKILAC